MTLFKALSRFHHLRCTLIKINVLNTYLLDKLACFTYHIEGIYRARLLSICFADFTSLTFSMNTALLLLSVILTKLCRGSLGCPFGNSLEAFVFDRLRRAFENEPKVFKFLFYLILKLEVMGLESETTTWIR